MRRELHSNPAALNQPDNEVSDRSPILRIIIIMRIWQTECYAAYEGNLDLAQLLLQSGANIEAQSRVSGVGASEWN